MDIIKPLDFVRAKGTVVRRWDEKGEPIPQEVNTNNIGIVVEVNPPSSNMPHYQASIIWLDNSSEARKGLFNAWWFASDLVIINSFPNLLTKSLAHPFGSNKDVADTIFPIK